MISSQMKICHEDNSKKKTINKRIFLQDKIKIKSILNKSSKT
jgi:hypothetical protein